MNGFKTPGWGIVSWPDTSTWRNVLTERDGHITKFDDALPMAIEWPNVPLSLPSNRPYLASSTHKKVEL
jgi:hypothetical protein